jgi:glycogen phosphorylase
LLLDAGRALALLAGERPIQIVLAGKAHPKDDEGKRLVQNLFGAREAPVVGQRVVFLEDYDLSSAARLVRGCDVWVNVPRPPLEASGTSGMKAGINGVPHLSIGDGWWAEGYNGSNGWIIDGGPPDNDHDAQDAADADALYRLLEEQVVPTYYQRDQRGIPHAWLRIVKECIRTVTPQFSATRMIKEYVKEMYVPAAQQEKDSGASKVSR